MTAAVRRARLAAIGADILAARGGPGERRGAALLRSLSRAPLRPIGLDALPDVPDWARLPRAARDRIADRVALRAMAPALARAIDGVALRGLAATCGEDALDWAMENAGTGAGDGLPLLAGDRLRGLGYALLGRTLPGALTPLLDDVAREEVAGCTDSLAARCLAEVMEAERA